MVVQNFGVAEASSDDTQTGGKTMEEIRWEKEMVKNSWAQREDRGTFQD